MQHKLLKKIRAIVNKPGLDIVNYVALYPKMRGPAK